MYELTYNFQIAETICIDESAEVNAEKAGGCADEQGDNELNTECCAANTEDEENEKTVTEEITLDPEDETNSQESHLGINHLLC